MKILSKGINLVSNLAGSSYLLEIDNLTKQYKYTVVLVHNNHQIDSLFDELNNIYNDRILLKYGYPADKIKWYRGGMQNWENLGFNTVK